MKKGLITIIICTLAVTAGFAQQKTLKGDGFLNIGIGFVPGFGGSISYDHAIIDTWGPGKFTIGGMASLHAPGNNELDWALMPRAGYRYCINNTFEVYGAATLGLVIETFSDERDARPDVGGGLVGGFRFSFSRSVALFGEAGFVQGASILTAGISLKL